MRRFLVALLVLSSVACYKTPKPDCAFRCGANDECPDGYLCGNDDQCHLFLASGQLAECNPLPVPAADAAVVADAVVMLPDAPEAEIDAPAEVPDAAEMMPDAPISMPDAPRAPDAPVPDARLPDAPVPDAKVFDAKVFDASPSDV